MNPLQTLFAPRSIAVIGASRREGTLGKMFLDAVVQMNYKGQIFPVNPKADNINGIQCYPDISALPVTPDLAIVLLPKEMVLDTIDQLNDGKIKNVIVVSAGFKEIGGDGQKREQELVGRIKKYGMRMIGPNSMGIFNTAPELSLNATFSPTQPIAGQVGFISQSGALGVAVLELSRDIGLGFSCFVSTGNKADIGDLDCLKYLAEDKNTKAIILYQEGIDNPAEFREACKKIVPYKPILTLKAGRTKSGHRAASSHTGALASNDIVTDAFFKQCGIIRCESLQELLDTARSITGKKLPESNRVAVITNAGGPGILASDALEKYGLQLAELSQKSIDRMAKILPTEAGLRNPIDMIASATHDIYKKTCQILDSDPNVDVLFVIIVKPPVDTTPQKIIGELGTIIDKSDKPFFLTVMARENEEDSIERFRDNHTPVFSFPESAARALGNIIRYKDTKELFTTEEPQAPDILGKRISYKNQKQASFQYIIDLLKKYHIETCDYKLTTEIKKVLQFQKSHGRTVIKIANEEILHKSDLGLVKLNITTPEEAEQAFRNISEKALPHLKTGNKPSILIQQMISSGVELVLGANQDPIFGPVIMFGIGGVFVELYKDVVFRVCPLTETDARQMINELQGSKILDGFRHFPVVNKSTLVQAIMNFSKMIEENPEIIEMDLNPLIYTANINKPVVVDSRCTVVRT